MSLASKMIAFAICVNLAFNMVNLTGIFTTEESVPVSYSKYEEKIQEIKSRFEGDVSTLDYLSAAGYALVYGLKLMLELVVDLLFVYDNILQAFYVPDEFAFVIGNFLNVLFILAIARMFRRGG